MAHKCLEQLIGLNELAARLGVQNNTMRFAVDRGYIDAVKIGNAWVTTRDQEGRYRAEHLGQLGRPAGVTEQRPRKRSTPKQPE